MTPRATASTSRPVRPGPHRRQTGELRREDDVVDAAQLLVELAGRQGARDVAAVAVHPRAHVDDDELAFSDATRARDGVGQRAVRPGGDDGRERLALGAESVQLLLDLPGDIRLGAAGQAPRHDGAQRLDGDVARPPDGGDLGGVLDLAQARHAALHVSEPAAMQTPQGPVVGVAEGACPGTRARPPRRTPPPPPSPRRPAAGPSSRARTPRPRRAPGPRSASRCRSTADSRPTRSRASSPRNPER